jgi:polar amino acid transport system substrate-binding protein
MTRRLTLLLLAILLWTGFASAQDQKLLLWGADARSDAPYAFIDPANQKELIGFEKEIIDALAERMGRTAKLVQNDWDTLIPGLDRHLYDVVINGLEITRNREEAVAFSEPYYYTFEQLAVRVANTDITSMADLKGRKVGTLKASLAERMLEKAGNIHVKVYDDEVAAYSDLANGRTEAVLLDFPIALYYAAPNPALKLVGDPIGRVRYGIAMRKNDVDLLKEVNDALRQVMDSGDLRRIVERWKLWTPTMASELNDFGPSNVAPVQYQRFIAETAPLTGWRATLRRYIGFLPLLGKAAIVTLEVSMLGMILAVGVGLSLAVLRQYGPTLVSVLAVGYIEAIRGTPLLIQVLFIFYGLPNIGIKLQPFVAGVLALGLNYAAYEAENYRAGLSAIPRGQMEAAIALNMTQLQALRYVVVPQAFRLVMPVMTNDFISLLKDSSLVSVITMSELTRTYEQLSTTYYDYFGTGLLVGAVYLLIGLPFVRLARWTEQRLTVDSHTGHRKHSATSTSSAPVMAK